MGGAVRAIERFDGAIWVGKRLSVKHADFGRMKEDRRPYDRGEKLNLGNHNWPTRGGMKQDAMLKWQDDRSVKVLEGNVKEGRKERKYVRVSPSEEQKELLGRSVLAEYFQPIKFGNLVRSLEKHWEEYGNIEVRDLGPRKCIVTFVSASARDDALANEMLLNYVDEARVYWGFKWSHSQRV
ncbi:hypothetical protein PIB30_028622 [Stylosanthes scabra]|uniref:RRM domain-containing protein n=1 Tax=Stylosanthes scabra TaxID=79078 RepID=A0ABU6Y9R3_9FABA|nr:hypothetical protein [Stylosanthes scabra]